MTNGLPMAFNIECLFKIDQAIAQFALHATIKAFAEFVRILLDVISNLFMLGFCIFCHFSKLLGLNYFLNRFQCKNNSQQRKRELEKLFLPFFLAFLTKLTLLTFKSQNWLYWPKELANFVRTVNIELSLTI